MIDTKEIKQEKIMNKKWEVCQEDEEKIANIIIDDFRNGKIGKITLEKIN